MIIDEKVKLKATIKELDNKIKQKDNIIKELKTLINNCPEAVNLLRLKDIETTLSTRFKYHRQKYKEANETNLTAFGWVVPGGDEIVTFNGKNFVGTFFNGFKSKSINIHPQVCLLIEEYHLLLGREVYVKNNKR